MNFVTGALLDEPDRRGKPLGQELTGTLVARRGECRIVCQFNDKAKAVTVLDVENRRDIYRRA